MSELGACLCSPGLAAGFARRVRSGLQTGVLVGLDRLELSTSPLSGARSSHLSYRPIWWSWSGSNRRPPECKSGALPTELQPPDLFRFAWLFLLCLALCFNLLGSALRLAWLFCLALIATGATRISLAFSGTFLGGRGLRFCGAPAHLILNRGQLNAGSPRPAR